LDLPLNPWKIIDRFTTAGNDTLELRRRGQQDFILFLDGQVLMNSSARRSEVALGRLGCRVWQNHPAPKVLVGGLGMGFTLKTVLDTLPANAKVVVAELNQGIVDWCRGPLAGLTDNVLSDHRVTVKIGDVADLIRRYSRTKEKGGFNAIILDLYQGPHAHTDKNEDPLYGIRAIAHMRAALRSGGTLAVWGETYDEGYVRRLNQGGFTVTCERPGKGGYRHAVFLATKKSEDLTKPQMRRKS
jgi:spermidine synthase